jgi:hypothetical protein
MSRKVNGSGWVEEAVFDEESGMSIVVKQSKYGTFTGIATLNEEDADVANKWDGCSFAEAKCDIQIARRKASMLYQRYLGARDVYNAVMNSAHDDVPELRTLEHQVNVMRRNYEAQRSKYREMRSKYKDYVDKKLDARRSVREKKLSQEV